MVEFEHVGLSYQNASEESLTDISFVARRGDVIGVIGGTGSGKTSLVNLIPRFYERTSGEIRIGGADIRKYPLIQLRGRTPEGGTFLWEYPFQYAVGPKGCHR